VLGQRESPDPERLQWEPADLVVPPQAFNRAGDEAAELASSLINDDRLRKNTARILQRAQGTAIAALLRFRRGDLKRALSEIRAQLADQNRELIILLEDLSVAEGLDGELIEALQVRTRDTGERLCTLRSIVGLTQDDYQRLQDNIKGRLTRTLLFNAPIGQGTTATENDELTAFSARYLNAVRLEANEISEWASGPSTYEVAPPSACETCPNRSDCHSAFGEVDGYGLYPLTAVAIGRLYRLVARQDGLPHAFNPRSLLKLLADFLDEAERSIERRSFPPNQMIETFRLRQTTAELQLTLSRELGKEGERTLRAIEVYAEQPTAARPALPSSIAAVFGLQPPSWRSDVRKRSPAQPARPQRARKEPRHAAPKLDVYDQWLSEGKPSDRSVNIWRKAIQDAVQAAIDWDVEGLAHLHSVFGVPSIRVEGQKTRVLDPILVVERTPESALTLRALLTPDVRQENNAELLLRTARLQIDAWANEVRRKITANTSRHAVRIGFQLLAIGSFIRGAGSRSGKEGSLLNDCFGATWDTPSEGRGTAWRALVSAYSKHGQNVQQEVRHAVSCTKGGKAGYFLDPSDVLETLRDVRGGELPRFELGDQTWGVFRNVGSLAQEVARHLQKAIEEERQAAAEWRETVGRYLGGDSPADVMMWVADALEAATTTGLGDGNLRRAVEGIQGRAVKGCLDVVDRVLNAADDVGRLCAIGTMDCPLMQEMADTVEMAGIVLKDREIQLEQRLRDAHGGMTEEEGLAEINEQLDRIEAAYKELAGEQEDGWD
jgi:hypothetical protein